MAVLLLLLTAVVVLSPLFISFYIRGMHIGQKEHWTYSRDTAAQITEKQLAEALFDTTVNIDLYKPSSANLCTDNIQEIKRLVAEELAHVFAQDEEALRYLHKAVLDTCLWGNAYEENILCVIGNRPIVLEMIHVEMFDKQNRCIRLQFEKKTQVLLYFVWSSDQVTDNLTTPLSDAVTSYYQTRLGLCEKQYSCHQAGFGMELYPYETPVTVSTQPSD